MTFRDVAALFVFRHFRQSCRLHAARFQLPPPRRSPHPLSPHLGIAGEQDPASRSAQSPPGATSSQSSASGSCYASSSSIASFAPGAPLSDPPSSSTSPASTYERGSSHSLVSPAGVDKPASPYTSVGFHNHSATSASGSASMEHQSDAHTLGSYSVSSSTAATRGPVQPNANGMNQSPSTSFSWNPTGHGSSYTAGANFSTHSDTAPESHAYGTSPESNRGPAAKARRTSPGGSRASGDLQPTNSASQYEHLSPRSHGTDVRRDHVSAQASEARLDTRRSHSPVSTGPLLQARPQVQRADDTVPAHQQQQQSRSLASQQGTPSRPSHLSPRSRLNSNSLAPSPSTFGTGASVGSSPGATSESLRAKSETSSRHKQPVLPKMDLATFPSQELLKVLATLLHEIATANDEFQPDGGKDDARRTKRSARSRDKAGVSTSSQMAGEVGGSDSTRNPSAPAGSHLSFNDARRPSITTAALGALTTPSSTLCFHARNVPSISIESYLLRILKYCPTTNEVFLSLLVYFDRMSRMGTGAKPGANGEGEVAGEAAGLPRAAERASGQMSHELGADTRLAKDGPSDVGIDTSAEMGYTHPGIRGFAIDSYNVHRLVIAGVTVASKFFSDVFYTNSRYAKVGGLPPHELNQLELQFLLLNDFRLTIPLEEMQRYADQLLMYGSGRPENVKMVKDVGLPAAPARPTASVQLDGGKDATPADNKSKSAVEPSSHVAAAVARDVSRDGAIEAEPSQQSFEESAPTEGEGTTDAQGDVQMQDA
ncbi:cyclin-domain-containing protein [Testicularia cyperi]|uniref:Cyclin-domain-containing protein n=1 Tax=Testicularia cyperi TaxID=1882483 RepID=A0A317XV71_9BASI|nr:cyclin-domain-containing protein [Testicularia cyperi]